MNKKSPCSSREREIFLEQGGSTNLRNYPQSGKNWGPHDVYLRNLTLKPTNPSLNPRPWRKLCKNRRRSADFRVQAEFQFLRLPEMAKRLVPLLNRVLIEKIVPPAKTNTGILLPEKSSKVNARSCSEKNLLIVLFAVEICGNRVLPEISPFLFSLFMTQILIYGFFKCCDLWLQIWCLWMPFCCSYLVYTFVSCHLSSLVISCCNRLFKKYCIMSWNVSIQFISFHFLY